MAYEPRLAIAFLSCGGSLGTKMNRRHRGQDLEDFEWDREYHRVAGNFFKWMGELIGGHTDAPDWPAFFQFAAKYFKVPGSK
jgi:hypothetical protein